MVRRRQGSVTRGRVCGSRLVVAAAPRLSRATATMRLPHLFQYISDVGFLNFKNHKYVSAGYSPLDQYVMTPFWNRVVEFYPRWLAPNLITLIGTICVLWPIETRVLSYIYICCISNGLFMT